MAPAVKAIARNLFAMRPGRDEDITPSPKRNNKRLTSLMVDDDGDDEIEIYTDSQDRYPEKDTSAENPFYGPGTINSPEPTNRSSKRRKISVPGEEDQTIEQLEQRKDGLVYVL